MTNADSGEVRRIFIVPMLVVIFLMTNLFLLYLLKKVFILDRKHEKTELELLKFQYLESDLKLYRQHRHDMKNHLTVIYQLVQNGKYDDLETYTKQYIQQTDHALIQVNTGMDELDVLLYNKFEIAKENHIEIDYHCKAQLIIKSQVIIDIVSIFSNLIDNAIEANRKIIESDERMITINIEDDQLDYVFVVTNAFLNKDNFDEFVKDGFTTKLDQKNHGLGLGIIHKLVEKYDGKVHIDIFNNKFYQIKIELAKHLL